MEVEKKKRIIKSLNFENITKEKFCKNSQENKTPATTMKRKLYLSIANISRYFCNSISLQLWPQNDQQNLEIRVRKNKLFLPPFIPISIQND